MRAYKMQEYFLAPGAAKQVAQVVKSLPICVES